MTSRPVLVTGGAGFIGRAVSALLHDAGSSARALDILNPQVHRTPDRAVAEFGGEVIVGDVRDTDAVAAAMAGCSAVIHLAAETGVGQSMYEVDRYTSVNVDGTRIVLDEARRLGLPVVVASSRAVYGLGAFECPEHGRVFGQACCEHAEPSASREDDRPAPVSIYGDTKLAAEKLAAESVAAGGQVVSVRPQNVIGAGQALHNPYTGVLAAFAARVRKGVPPQVYAPGLQTRDFIAVQDVAASLAWLLEHVERWTQYPILNLGSGTRVTLREVAETACRAAGAPVDIELVEITRPGDIDHACADLHLARAAGLPEAVIPFADSVRAFIEFAAEEDPVDPRIWDTALDELSAAKPERGTS